MDFAHVFLEEIVASKPRIECETKLDTSYTVESTGLSGSV